MVDALFEHPRLVAIYDALHPDRDDLDAYVGIVDELGAHRVLDVGCGTGTFALLLADRGVEVVGLDPAAGSLAVARAKPGADRVQWVHGDATSLPPMEVDLATMTGNVSQAIADRPDWEATLRGVHRALRPGGHLVLETRDPAFQGWREWNRAESYRSTTIDGVGTVDNWVDVTDIDRTEPDSLLVSFRWTFVFALGRVHADVGLDAALPRAGRGRGRSGRARFRRGRRARRSRPARARVRVHRPPRLMPAPQPAAAAFAFMSRRSSGGSAKSRLSSAERTSSTSA